MIRITSLVLAASASLALAVTSGCSKANSGPPAPTSVGPSPQQPGDPQEAARAIFSMRCAACHGTGGTGDGAAAAQLNPKPRNFKDTAWQTSVTDEHIEKIIRDGGPAVGKSPAMPPNPDLVAKPEVVAALRGMIRAFGQ